MCDDLLNERQHFINVPSLKEANALVDDYNKLLAYFLDDTDGFSDDGPLPQPSKIKPGRVLLNKASRLLEIAMTDAESEGVQLTEIDKLKVVADMCIDASRQNAVLIIYFAYIICDEYENNALQLLEEFTDDCVGLDNVTKEYLTTYIEEQNSNNPTE